MRETTDRPGSLGVESAMPKQTIIILKKFKFVKKQNACCSPLCQTGPVTPYARRPTSGTTKYTYRRTLSALSCDLFPLSISACFEVGQDAQGLINQSVARRRKSTIMAINSEGYRRRSGRSPRGEGWRQVDGRYRCTSHPSTVVTNGTFILNRQGLLPTRKTQ